MTKEEFLKIAGVLKANYTDPKFLPDRFAYDVWFSSLKDLSAAECQASVLKWINTNRNTPTIADIRQNAAEIKSPKRRALHRAKRGALLIKRCGA